MSIIKRKAGSEDIVKSVLEFDEVPTEGSHNLVESGAMAKAIGNLGQPLQWKGPATVAQLNAGITGIQPGWTYTLTDAGTLTDGSIDVEAGDEVAWTEDDEWFKVGGDAGKLEIFTVTFPSGVKTYPDGSEILNAINAGKYVVIDQPNLGVWEHTFWLLQRANRGPQDHIYFEWKDRILVAERDNTAETPTWTWFEKDIGFAKTKSVAPEYADLTFPVAVGTACMHDGLRYVANTTISTAEAWTTAHWTKTSVEDTIGNVEALLAAL